MSVDNIFSSEMYHNEQWCMTHSGNVISIKMFKIILLMKEHNKKQSIWISVSCYGSNMFWDCKSVRSVAVVSLLITKNDLILNSTPENRL